MKSRILSLMLALAVLAVPAAAQFTTVSLAPVNGVNCPYSPGLAIDLSTGEIAGCGTNHVWAGVGAGTAQTFTNKTIDSATNTLKSNGTTVSAFTGTLGNYQGTTATSITTGNFTSLTGPNIKIPANAANVANKKVTITYKGVYTNAAASLLNSQILICTTSNACGATTVAPAGCVVTTTNQANNLTNGQFTAVCELTTATIGAAGTLMAKSTGGYNLGAATSAVLSYFQDLATALSAAVDLTQDEYLVPQFKFTTSNAGNSATVQSMSVDISG